MVNGTRIISGDNLHNYIDTRLFGSNVRPENVKKICLHNGFLPSQLITLLKQFSSPFTLVEQENAREPIFFSKDVLHIPQYSSLGRQGRYEDMCDIAVQEVFPEIEFQSYFFGNDASNIRLRYEALARDLVNDIFSNGHIDEVDNIIFGPLEAVAQEAEVIKAVDNEYLPYQFVDVDGKTTLNLGYVYETQLKYLIKSIADHFYGRAISKDEKKSLNFFLFGRAAAIDKEEESDDSLKINDLVTPVTSLDEFELRYKKPMGFSLSNILASEGERGANLSASSVVNQTKETLLKALHYGCICAEMEERAGIEGVIESNRNYNREPKEYVHSRFGCALHISDRPLLGETLATERNLKLGEQRAVRMILNYVKSH